MTGLSIEATLEHWASSLRDVKTRMRMRDIVRGYALEALADPDAVLMLDETGFSSKARRPVVLVGNTPGRRARSPIARSVCSHLMSPGMVTPPSTGRSGDEHITPKQDKRTSNQKRNCNARLGTISPLAAPSPFPASRTHSVPAT